MTHEEELKAINENLAKLRISYMDLSQQSHDLKLRIMASNLNKKEYSEKDLYDFAMSVLWPRFHFNKRHDIIQDWATESVDQFKKQVQG